MKQASAQEDRNVPGTAPFEVFPDPQLRSQDALTRQVTQRLKERAPQAATLATQAGTLAGKAALWLALWAVSALLGVILFVMMLAGYAYAGPLLLLLLLATAGLLWQKLSQLQKGKASSPQARRSSPSTDEQLDPRIRQHISDLSLLAGRADVGPLQDKLRYTANLMAEALRATAAQGGLITREAHDVRAAAERDLPQALQTFQEAKRGGASTSYAELLLAEQLDVLQKRMLEVLQQHSLAHLRDLEAQRTFLKDKYSQ